jgi:hypothetical protein
MEGEGSGRGGGRRALYNQLEARFVAVCVKMFQAEPQNTNPKTKKALNSAHGIWVELI